MSVTFVDGILNEPRYTMDEYDEIQLKDQNTRKQTHAHRQTLTYIHKILLLIYSVISVQEYFLEKKK